MPSLRDSQEMTLTDRRETLFLWAIIIGACLLRVYSMVRAEGFLFDDAYITLRFGRNLLSGHGLVYNAGENVLGAPPLYAALVGILWKLSNFLTGGDGAVGYFVTVFNTLLVCGTIALLHPLLNIRPRWVSFLPLIAFAFYYPFLDNAVSGMETSLFVFLLCLSLYALQRNHTSFASAVLGLSMLVRAEGVLWTGGILIFELFFRRRFRIRSWIPLLIIVLGWILVSTSFYGSPIPQNVQAKSGWFEGTYGSYGVLRQALSVVKSFSTLPWRLSGNQAWGLVMSLALIVFLLLSAKGLVSLWRRRDRNLVWGVFFVFCVVFYVVGRGATWPSWYAIPPGLALFVMASHGVAPWLESIRLGPRPQWLLLGALSIILFVVSVFTWPRIRSNYATQMEKTYGVVGRYLAENSSPSDTLLVREIGYIGFLADRYILDQAGIVSPPVLKLRLEDLSNGEPIQLIRRFRPQFVVEQATFRKGLLEGEHIGWFDENYSRVQRTPWYHIFERIDPRGK